jgi:hypothetical protein
MSTSTQGGNSPESIYEKHVGSNMEMEYLPTPKANVLAAMEEYAAIKAVAFAEWMMDRYYPVVPGFYGRLPKRYEPVSTGYPIDQIFALFLQDTK